MKIHSTRSLALGVGALAVAAELPAVIGALDAAIDHLAFAQRAATVHAGIADYASPSFGISERHDVDAKYLNFRGCVGGEIFAANDGIPEINVHSFLLRNRF